MLQHTVLFSNVTLASVRKEKTVKIKNFKKYNNILAILLKKNFIKGVLITKKCYNKELILILSNNNIKIKPISKPSFIRFMKLNQIKRLENKNTASLYIFSTSLGFLSLHECIRKSTGGIPVCRVYAETS